MSIKYLLKILSNYQSRSLIIKTFLKTKHNVRNELLKQIKMIRKDKSREINFPLYIKV